MPIVALQLERCWRARGSSPIAHGLAARNRAISNSSMGLSRVQSRFAKFELLLATRPTAVSLQYRVREGDSSFASGIWGSRQSS